jgi:CheY-like chemotaxis protein
VKGKHPHILIADDDWQVLALFVKLLEKAGYLVTAVNSGSAAVKVLQDKSVDLLILDLSMPQPDGFEVLKTLRDQTPGLRILVISGFLQGTLLKASEFLGATASLEKADAPEALLKTVNALLRESAGQV